MRKRLAKKREPVKRKKCVLGAGVLRWTLWESSCWAPGWMEERKGVCSVLSNIQPSFAVYQPALVNKLVSLEINQFLRIFDSERCFCWTVQAIVSKPRNCSWRLHAFAKRSCRRDWEFILKTIICTGGKDDIRPICQQKPEVHQI